MAMAEPNREGELEQLRRRVAELELLELERSRQVALVLDSEARFGTLIANVPGAVYRSEAHAPWRDSFASEHVEALCGFTAYELTRPGGTAFGDLILEEDRRIVEESVARAAERGGTFEVRYRIRHADGGIRWVHDQGRVAVDPDGTPRWLEGVVVDVTRQMEVELALRESEERFRTLVGNIPGGVYRCEVQWPYRDIFLSEGVEAITGYSPERHLSGEDLDFGARIFLEDRARIEAEVQHAVSTRSAFSLRYRIRHADGGIRWVHEQGRATYDANGAPRFLDGVLVDITAQVLAEESSREREERIRTIVENEPECVALLDGEGNLIEMNPAGLRMIEADRQEQIRGRSIITLVDPADQPAFREMITAIFRGHSRTLVFELVGLRGTRRTLETHSVPLWDGPEHREVRGLLGVTRDITERRRAEAARHESEERYRSLVASVPGAVYLCQVDTPWKDVFMSEGVRALTGYDPEKFLQADGITFNTITLEEDLPLVTAEVEAALGRRGVFESRYRIRHADGGIRWVYDQGRAVYDQEGRALFITGVILDITDRMAAEEAVREHQRQLRQAQKMEAIGTLAGGIAHDFNNILTAILGHAELLARGLSPNATLQEEVEGILGASHRARELVQQILTFSRQREQERTLIALQPVVLEALRMLRATLPSSIEIRTEIASEADLVLADATQVHRVVVNLCANAAHAMRERGGVLSVSYGSVQVDEAFAHGHPGLRPGVYARLTVSDTGHGMDPKTLERIFDPFFTTKAPGEGTGLGLAVLHGIMQSHGGLVTVESQLGKGSSFHLYFPSAGAPEQVEPPKSRPTPGGRGEHILIVDDEPAVVGIARRGLIQVGYQVTGHTHPLQALEEFRQNPDRFALVLCDLTMPHMSGLVLIAELLQIRPGIPVVLASGYSGTLGPEDLRRAGIRELLGKPFTMQALAETIHRNLYSAG